MGRGVGSGSAKTSGRGTKGAGARAGRKHKPHREGGQIPLHHAPAQARVHATRWRVDVQVVNVKALARFKKGAEVDAAALVEAGLIRSASRPVKLLGEGALEAALQGASHFGFELRARQDRGARAAAWSS